MIGLYSKYILFHQKIIGQLLGSYITVRKLCQINSQGIRAIRLILGEKRLTKRKIAVLIGGPDWPTSVMCGKFKIIYSSYF